MSIVTNKYWWLTAAIALVVLNLWSIIVEGAFSELLLFTLLFNMNFFIYSVCNKGSLLIKRERKPSDNRIVADFHYSINFLKFIAMIIFVLFSIAGGLHDYMAWYIIALLIIDTVLIVIRRKRVIADVK